MIDDKADKLNNERLTDLPESSSEYGGLEAELQKNLGQAVKNEMQEMSDEEMVEIYENSNTLKGMVAKRKKELMDEKEEERKKSLFLIIKLGTVMGLLGIVIIFASIAWFAMNRDVGGGGMSVSIAKMPFEIAVKGTDVRNSGSFIKADSSYTYGDDTKILGYYLTGTNSDQIKVRYTPTTDDVEDFGPGSSGVIEIYVVPNINGDLTIQFDLDVIGFKEHGVGQNKSITRIADLSTSNSNLEQTDIDNCLAADSYLKGHIMFFEEPGDTASTTLEGSRYYYKKPITTNTLIKTFFNAQKNVPQKVTFYWMWANTLGQIALKDNTSGFRSDYPIVQDATGSDISNTDKGKVIKYLKDNKEIVFTNYSEFADINNAIDNANVKENFKKLSEGYNSADFMIGSYVSYFLIDISASLAEGE